MANIYDIGVNIILYLQSLGDWLIPPMKFITFLGNEEFFLLFMPVLYWCIDSLLGLRMGVILMFSTGLGFILKIFFHTPRPYWYSAQVPAQVHEPSFGVPSGHSMTGVAGWGLLATTIRRSWSWIILIAVIVLIGLSRIFLGAHFPVDVLTGWISGLIFLWAFLSLEKPVVSWLAKKSVNRRYLVVFTVSLAFILVAWFAKSSLGDWKIPTSWVENAATAFPEGEPIDPLSLSGIVSAMGAFFGMAAGAIWLNERAGFDASGNWIKRLLRYPLGLVGIIALWYGLGMIFPDGESLLAFSLRFLRYALVGSWITAFAPLVFIRLKLAVPLQ